MAEIRFTPDPNNPPDLTSAQWVHLDARTDAELTAAAESDPDNPPLTENELARLKTARMMPDVKQTTIRISRKRRT